VDQLVGGSGAGAGNNRTIQVARCDPYFESHNVTLIPGIRGLASGVFLGKIDSFLLRIDINFPVLKN